jgi:Ca-activated chloride channel family protein
LPFAEASEDFRFASSVALFGMQLRDSKYTGEGNLEKVVAMAEGSLKDDPKGYRLEFLQLAQASLALKQQSTRSAASRSPLSGR